MYKFFFVILVAVASWGQSVSSIPAATGGGGGGTYTAGYGLILTGDQFSANNSILAPFDVLQTGAPWYCRSTSGNDSYACTVAPAITSTSLTRGQFVFLDPDTANTGAASLSIGGGTARDIVTNAGGTPANGVIVANRGALLYWNGTAFSIVGGGGIGTAGIIDLPIGGANLFGPGQFRGYIVGNTQVAEVIAATISNLRLEYNASTAASVIWKFRFPRRWSTGTVSLQLMAYTGGAVNQTFELDASIVCANAGTAFTPSFPGATPTGLINPLTVANTLVTVNINSIPTAGCAAGDLGQIQLRRTAGVGTMTADGVAIAAAALLITEQ